MLLYSAMLLLFGYALLVSIHAWFVAPPGIVRTRAGMFAIAYGILRTQLFDIDLRIKWTIKQSTLATEVNAVRVINAVVE